jgi:hypothetical protein
MAIVFEEKFNKGILKNIVFFTISQLKIKMCYCQTNFVTKTETTLKGKSDFNTILDILPSMVCP